MMAPKLRFSHGLKAKAPGAVTACVPGPLRRRSLKFLQARQPRLAQEATMGKLTIFFFYLRGVFQVYDCYFTNILTQRPCLGFLLTADSQCFTRNDARTFVPTIPRRRLWQGERSLWVETSRSSFPRSVVIFPPGAPVTSFLSQQISTVTRRPRFQQDETKPALSSFAVVTKAIKRTARTGLSHLGTSTTLFPAIWTKTARSIEELFSQWKRPRRASSDQRTDDEDTSETCNNNHVGGRALTNA